jgi:hypothetical protein
MAEKFLEYKGKPLVRCGEEIYYGDMSESHVVKFTILSNGADGEPNKMDVALFNSDTSLSDKDRIVKKSTKSTMFDALDIGFVWLERTLK